ncbi:MAG: cyclic nucleotide-binding domain-containing protein [Desulfosarcinaceae bacterium]|nr:cyclic nucleotide-binding domain-containing protein [Desulfosarcinaceae bacterium]
MSSNSEGLKTGASCEITDNIGILREVHFFAGLPLEVVKLFAYLCTRESFKAGDFLFRQGDDDGCAYFTLSGEVELRRRETDREVTLRRYPEGSFFGSLSLMGPMPRLFSLQAATDLGCLILTREKFAKISEQFPAIGPKIVASVVGRVLKWEKQVLKEMEGDLSSCQHCIGISLL